MRRFPLVATVIAAGAIGLGLVIRYGFLEQQAMNEACWAATAPWWCAPRQALGTLIHVKAIGLASLVAAALAVAFGWRAFVLGALVLGGLGLVLYNTDFAAVGFAVGALRAIRA